MIVGIGTDIVETRRIAGALRKFGSRFEEKILLASERRSGLGDQARAAYLARQFAAKEAVAKVLGTGMRSGVHFRTIEVLRNEYGEPRVTLKAGARAAADRRRITSIKVSISDEAAYAVAFAVAETEG